MNDTDKRPTQLAFGTRISFMAALLYAFADNTFTVEQATEKAIELDKAALAAVRRVKGANV